MLTYERTDDYELTLSDEALRKLAAENARRIQSSCIYEISAGVGLGGFVVAIVWMLVRTHTGG
jgi:hypothetical protein